MKTQKLKEHGKITIEKRDKLRSRFVFVGAGKQSRRADQRLNFLAQLSGATVAILRDSPKGFSALWGSDKVLVIRVRFLKGCRNLP